MKDFIRRTAKSSAPEPLAEDLARGGRSRIYSRHHAEPAASARDGRGNHCGAPAPRGRIDRMRGRSAQSASPTAHPVGDGTGSASYMVRARTAILWASHRPVCRCSGAARGRRRAPPAAPARAGAGGTRRPAAAPARDRRRARGRPGDADRAPGRGRDAASVPAAVAAAAACSCRSASPRAALGDRRDRDRRPPTGTFTIAWRASRAGQLTLRVGQRRRRRVDRELTVDRHPAGLR